MVVQEGPLRFLFDTTGDLFYGRGFEMLAILEANFRPDTLSRADEECIHEF
jgi:hypothetical protein